MRMNHVKLYDALWRIIGADGRQEALFGDRCTRLAREAFLSSAAGDAMPIVYLEVPLAGEPRFDLQVCIERTSFGEGAPISVPEEAPAEELALLSWLTGAGGADCTGVDLAFDISAGDVTTPQLITLMKRGSLPDAETFFSITGMPEAAARYRTAELRTPKGWNSWYTGVIPQREGSPVRLDYYVDEDVRHTYAQDVDLLARDLERMGYALSERERAWCGELLSIPHKLNLQLDMRDDGTLGPVLGYNLNEGSMGPDQTKECLEDGWMRQALEFAETWGLTDGRWHRLKELCMGRLFALRDDHGECVWMAMKVLPTFIKIRMTQDALVDAKAYVMCVLTELELT